jgi:hypothetical protein
MRADVSEIDQVSNVGINHTSRLSDASHHGLDKFLHILRAKAHGFAESRTDWIRGRLRST